TQSLWKEPRPQGMRLRWARRQRAHSCIHPWDVHLRSRLFASIFRRHVEEGHIRIEESPQARTRLSHGKKSTARKTKVGRRPRKDESLFHLRSRPVTAEGTYNAGLCTA